MGFGNSRGGGSLSGIMSILSFGYMIYSLLNPKKAKKPKPEELQINNFQRNLPVPLCYGVNKYDGTVMAIGRTGLSEVGSKGSSLSASQSIEGYVYYADFAIGLSEGTVNSILNLFYNEESFIDVEDLASRVYYNIYYGNKDQIIEPNFLSFFGNKSIPFKNTSYIFFSADLGSMNSLPSIGAEVAGLLSYRGNDIHSPFMLTGWGNLACNVNAGSSYTQIDYYGYNNKIYWYSFNYTTQNLTIGQIKNYDVLATIELTDITVGAYQYTLVGGEMPTEGFLFPTKYPQQDRVYSFTTNEDGSLSFDTCNTRITLGLNVGDILECRINDYIVMENIKYNGLSPDYHFPGQNKDWRIRTNWFPYQGYLYAIQPYFRFASDISDYGRWYSLRAFRVHLETGTIEIFNDFTAVKGEFFIQDPYEINHLFISSSEISASSMYFFNKYGFWHAGFMGACRMSAGTGDFILIESIYNVGYGLVPINNKSCHFKNHDLFYLYGTIAGITGRWTCRFVFNGYTFVSNKMVGDNINFPYGYIEDAVTINNDIYTAHKVTHSDNGVGIIILKNGIVFANCLVEEFQGIDLSGLTVSIAYVELIKSGGILYTGCVISNFGEAGPTSGGYICFQVSLRNDLDSNTRVREILVDWLWSGGTPDIHLISNMDIETFKEKVQLIYNFDHKLVLELGVHPGTGNDTNPIEVCYDFMTNKRYGCGIDTSLFDGDPYTNNSGSWRTEYLYCQEEIATDVGTFEARFLYADVFLNRRKGFDIINDILQTCRAFLYFCDGLIKVKIQKNDEEPVLYFGIHRVTFNSINASDLTKIYADFSSYPTGYWNGDLGECIVNIDIKIVFIVTNQTTTYIDIEIQDYFSESNQILESLPISSFSFELSKDNIKEGSFSYKRKESREISNKFRVRYQNRTDEYKEDDIEYDNVYDIELTDEIREIEFEMSGIKRNTQARRITQFLSDYDSYVIFGCSFQTDIIGMTLCLGAIVGLTEESVNWIGKLFRVISMEELEDYEVKVDCVEYIPSVFHDYAVPVQDINNSDLSGKYDTPDQIERMFLYEARDNNYVYIGFKRPDKTSNPFWRGAVIYFKESGGEYENIGITSIDTSSVQLVGDISFSDETIYYDPNTMYGSFPSSGSFWIDAEEISYSGIDVLNNSFTGCTRGYNLSTSDQHLDGSYINLVNTDLFKWKYTYEDIGKVFYFKLVSMTTYNIYANTSSAPEESINLVGYFMLAALTPYPVSNLIIIEI